VDEINVVIAGAAGEGVQTIGDMRSNVAAEQGHAVFSWTEAQP
jgi:Pyruvate/2-oxoacid:ferredoxin oxidoreductase gamma subunit